MDLRGLLTEGCILTSTAAGYYLGQPLFGIAAGIGLQTGLRRGTRDSIDSSSHYSRTESGADRAGEQNECYYRSLVYGGIITASVAISYFFRENLELSNIAHDIIGLGIGFTVDRLSYNLAKTNEVQGPVRTFIRVKTSSPDVPVKINSGKILKDNCDDSGAYTL